MEFGVLAGLAASSLSFTKADFTTKARTDYSAGLVSRLNLGSFGLQLEALYECANSRFPSIDTPLGVAQNYMQQGVTVPAYVLVRSSASRDALFFGLGGYYSYVFSHSLDKSDPGWTVNPAGLLVQWSFRRQLGSLFAPDAPEVHLGTASYITVGWFF